MADNKTGWSSFIGTWQSLTDSVSKIMLAVLAVVSAVGAVVASVRTKPLISTIGFLLAIGAAGWVARQIRRSRSQPGKLSAIKPDFPAQITAFCRFPLPFNCGERLPGRDSEVGAIKAMVEAPDFRVGYLTGDAGVGKTSLLRAGLIPLLEAEGFAVAYVSRSGPDPFAEAYSELRLKYHNVPDSDFFTFLQSAVKTHQGSKIVLIFDQFEEFFLAHNRQQDRRNFFEQIRGCIDSTRAQRGSTRFLLAVRKEFADDFNDFGFLFPSLDRSRMKLHLWTKETTEVVLDFISKQDDLPFSGQLKSAILDDLSQDGLVLPVRFQLLVTQLKQMRIYDRDTYERLGRARGVTATYVTDLLRYSDQRSPDALQLATSVLLRSLCSEDGLTRTQATEQKILFDRVASTLLTRYPEIDANIALVFSQALQRCIDNQLVVIDANGDISLAHDYLAPIIRGATAGTQSNREEADRLLRHYIARSQVDAASFIPYRELTFIRKNASPDRLASNEKLIRKSNRRVWAIAGGAFLFVLAVPLFTLPLGPRFDVAETTEVGRGSWFVSPNNRLVVRSDDKQLWIFQPEDRWEKAVRLSVPSYRVIPSRTGQYVIVCQRDGDLSIWQTSEIRNLKEKAKPISKVPYAFGGSSFMTRDAQAGFSEDDMWVWVITPFGELFIWRAESSKPKKVLDVPKNLSFFYQRPYVLRFLPDGKHAAFSAEGQLSVFRYDIDQSPTDLTTAEISRTGRPTLVRSYPEQWINGSNSLSTCRDPSGNDTVAIIPCHNPWGNGSNTLSSYHEPWANANNTLAYIGSDRKLHLLSFGLPTESASFTDLELTDLNLDSSPISLVGISDALYLVQDESNVYLADFTKMEKAVELIGTFKSVSNNVIANVFLMTTTKTGAHLIMFPDNFYRLVSIADSRTLTVDCVLSEPGDLIAGAHGVWEYEPENSRFVIRYGEKFYLRSEGCNVKPELAIDLFAHHIIASSNFRTLFFSRGPELFLLRGGNPTLIGSMNSAIDYLVPTSDPSRMVVLANQHFSSLRHGFFLWGINVLPIALPVIDISEDY